MKATFDHLTLYVGDFEKSAAFYRDLFSYLGGKVVLESRKHLGLSLNGGQIWLKETEPDFKKHSFHRKRIGVNHLAWRVTSPEEVDQFYREYLKPRGITPLYNSPAHYPYTEKYYAVYFEDPDRLKLEVVFL